MNYLRIALIASLLCATLSMTATAAPAVVERSCTVLDLSSAGKRSAKLAFLPTGEGDGKIVATRRGEQTEIEVDVRDLPAADEAGGPHLTHVLWAVDDDGVFTPLGELTGATDRARLTATVAGARFGLLVTAEPYFAVSRPSDAVVMKAVAQGKAVETVSMDQVACKLVDSGYYAFGRTDVVVALTLKRDAKTPLDMLQARNAYKIAELAGAARYLPVELEDLAAMLLEAEREQSSKAGSRGSIEKARQCVSTAEQIRAMAEQAQREADDARLAADLRAEAEREKQRLADELRDAEKLEARRAADEVREREMQTLAEARAAQEAELARLAAARKALQEEIEAESARRAEAFETPLEDLDTVDSADAGTAADEAAEASLVAERSRLVAERAQLDAQRVKQEADAVAERARIEAERATLRAQLAEETVAREREDNAIVKAEIEEMRRQAEQARIEAELAKRDAEITAERARLEVERAQLEAQRKTTESEAALRQQYQTEAAENSAVRTEEQRQAEMERVRQQFELEQQQREMELERERLAGERLAEQQTLEQNRRALDTEREEIVARLAADQARLAAEREELERVRREEAARYEAESEAADAERARELDASRAAMQADLESKRTAMEREMSAERQRLQAEMLAEIEAEHARLRAEFERQSERIEQDAAAAEAERARQAEQDRRARREQLLTQLTAVLDARDTDRGLLVNLDGVSFAAGQHELQSVAREKLARVAGILLANPSLAVAIDGHTDSTGSAMGNQILSERRATAVRDYLVLQGVPTQSMTVTGLGSTAPLASNETAEGRRANRRIELLISGAAIELASNGSIQ